MGEAHAMQVIKSLHVLLGRNQDPHGGVNGLNFYAVQLMFLMSTQLSYFLAAFSELKHEMQYR